MSDQPENLAAILTEMHDERIIRLADADVTRCLLHNLADRIEAAVERERDRLRDIVRRLAELSESLLANYEYRYREDANSMAFVGNARDFIREARAAIWEGAR